MKSSSRRSREFAIKATLIWICDSVDAYLQSEMEDLSVFPRELKENIKNINSIGRRLEAVAREAGVYDTYEHHLVQLAIVWRNRVTHYNPKNKISQETRVVLAQNAEEIHQNFQGLDVNRIISHALQSPPKAPTFKEIASLIRATHRLIEKIDESLISKLDMDDYFEEIIKEYLRANDIEDVEGRHLISIRRVRNVWGKQDGQKYIQTGELSSSRRASALIQIAQNYGMSPVCNGEFNSTSSSFLKKLVIMEPLEVAEQYKLT